MNLFMQVAGPQSTFWHAPNGSDQLKIGIFASLVVGALLIFALTRVPTRFRSTIVAGVTFLAGLFYVLFYVWPEPVGRKPGDLPLNAFEGVGFWLKDAFPVVAKISNIVSGFLLGLGVYSVIRVHVGRLAKKHRDSFFSGVLLVCVVLIVVVGYWDWAVRQAPGATGLGDPKNWSNINYAQDLLFDGLLQQMDAAMFSVIAFYILSAAYRAFRIRSIEATMLLATALVVMLSLMGLVEFEWGQGVNALAGGDKNSFLQNFTLTSISTFLRQTFQTPSIRAIDWGIGIGAMAMGLRLWLSLEKLGGNS